MSDKKGEFIVSARKYRPANWEQVIGQESITETLRNSIEQEHLAHAYLFCGPRGVGKTTCARIFAKEINRSDEHLDEDFSFNIFELDAASNNKVDDIRNLTDQVRIPPQIGEYKVYIIDEVHMLSTQAFNAFLKTLEEPPKHAIFILATTEKHKIIPTILSRCQIYDFNRITVEEIVKHLRAIADKESIKAEEEALHVIAQKADGALRDALSIFDQLANFTDRNLTYEAVLKNLHVLDYDYYFRLIKDLSQADYTSGLLLLDEILKLGFDAGHFIGGLGSHLRDLLVCQDSKTVGLLEVGDAVKAQYYEQAKSVSPEWILSSLKECQQAEFRIKTTMNQRLLLEVTLLSIASLEAEKKNLEPRVIPTPPKPLKEPETPVKQARAEVTKPTEPEAKQEVVDTEPEPQKAETEPEPKPETSNESQHSEQTAPVVAAEPAPPTRTRTRRKPTTISLSIDAPDPASNETQSVKEVINESPAPSGQALSVEEAWKKMCEDNLSEGKSALYTILNRQEVSAIFKDNTFTVNLHHGVEEEEFGHHRADVLQSLRSLCENSELQLSTEFTEQVSETRLFSAKDKFEHLAKKNPNLIKLKQDLDLDISF